MLKGDNNDTLFFSVQHIQQIHITMPVKLTCCIDIYGGVQMQQNQKHEVVDLELLVQLLHR